MSYCIKSSLWKNQSAIEPLVEYVHQIHTNTLKGCIYNLYHENIKCVELFTRAIRPSEFIIFEGAFENLSNRNKFNVCYGNGYNAIIPSIHPMPHMIETDLKGNDINYCHLDFNPLFESFNDTLGMCGDKLKADILNLPALCIWMKLHIIRELLIDDVRMYVVKLLL